MFSQKYTITSPLMSRRSLRSIRNTKKRPRRRRGKEKGTRFAQIIIEPFRISKPFSGQLDPANHKTIVDIQRENYEKNANAKGKGRVLPGSEDEIDQMDVDVDVEDMQSEVDEADMNFKPMPDAGGIEALREKLQTKIALLRRAGRPMNGEAGDKDDLLEERRRQRAAMRERRRKETKDKIRREEEMKGKKTKGKERRDTGTVAKVGFREICRPRD
jgi:hypothetical protein